MKHLILAACLLLATPFTAVAESSLKDVAYINGKWSVTSSFYDAGNWQAPSTPMRATADSVLGGSFVRLTAPIAFPGGTFQFEVTFSYDRFHQTYRLAFLDDLNGYLDVYEGQLQDGVLTVNNADTGSSFPDGNGGVVIGRLDVSKTDAGFEIMSYIASEKAGPYAPYMRLAFTAAE